MKESIEIIQCPVHQAALKSPGRIAIYWGSRRITYAQLDQYVFSSVRGFKERGIKPEQRVALVGDNSIEYVIALLGLWRLGAIACPINPKFPSQTIHGLLKSLKVQSVVVGKNFSFEGMKPSCQQIAMADLIVYDAKDVISNSPALTVVLPLDQEAAIVLTSGSTSEPKAAVLTYGNLYFNALGSNTVIPLDEQAVWLLSLPLFHVSGLGIVMRCLITGAAMMIAPKEETVRLITQGKVTHVSMVATQLQRWLASPEFQSSENLKALLLGGSALPKNLLQYAMEKNLPVYVSYGLTEMASQVATGKLLDLTKSQAKVLPYRELKIENDGEICVRGKTLFKGYLQGDSIQLPLDSQGWFHTGDLGRLDEHGSLVVLGRKDNMFISGGENIHPEEIEAALLKIEGIEQAVVVPKEDVQFGHRPVAFVQWGNDQIKIADDVLGAQLGQVLPKFKIPVAFYRWPTVQVQDGLKLDRRIFEKLASEA